MLHYLNFILLFFFQIPLCMAEDHKAWALQQQEQSQEAIKPYEQEAFRLKRQSLPIKERSSIKGCAAHQSLGCSQKQALHPAQKSYDSSLYIFISFSMPKETLKALAVEAKKHNAVLVMRGLTQNSFVKTAALLQEMGEGVVLGPTLFKEYGIQVVPTFVRKHTKGYLKIAGNVSLAYVLSKFREEEKLREETKPKGEDQ